MAKAKKRDKKHVSAENADSVKAIESKKDESQVPETQPKEAQAKASPQAEEIAARLKAQFPADAIEMGGASGNEVAQKVNIFGRDPSGTILYLVEMKGAWSQDLVQNAAIRKAETKAKAAIIVTDSFPEGEKGFHADNGVYAASMENLPIVSRLVRDMVVSVEKSKFLDERKDLLEEVFLTDFKYEVPKPELEEVDRGRKKKRKDILEKLFIRTAPQKDDEKIKRFVKDYERRQKLADRERKKYLKKVYAGSILVLKVGQTVRERGLVTEISDKSMGFIIFPDGSLGDWGPDENAEYDYYFKDVPKEEMFKLVLYTNAEFEVM